MHIALHFELPLFCDTGFDPFAETCSGIVTLRCIFLIAWLAGVVILGGRRSGVGLFKCGRVANEQGGHDGEDSLVGKSSLYKYLIRRARPASYSSTNTVHKISALPL